MTQIRYSKNGPQVVKAINKEIEAMKLPEETTQIETIDQKTITRSNRFKSLFNIKATILNWFDIHPN